MHHTALNVLYQLAAAYLLVLCKVLDLRVLQASLETSILLLKLLQIRF